MFTQIDAKMIAVFRQTQAPIILISHRRDFYLHKVWCFPINVQYETRDSSPLPHEVHLFGLFVAQRLLCKVIAFLKCITQSETEVNPCTPLSTPRSDENRRLISSDVCYIFFTLE